MATKGRPFQPLVTGLPRILPLGSPLSLFKNGSFGDASTGCPDSPSSDRESSHSQASLFNDYHAALIQGFLYVRQMVQN
jgi:hypothetical protein